MFVSPFVGVSVSVSMTVAVAVSHLTHMSYAMSRISFMSHTKDISHI